MYQSLNSIWKGTGLEDFFATCNEMFYDLSTTGRIGKLQRSLEKLPRLNPKARQEEEAHLRKIEEVITFIESCAKQPTLSQKDRERIEYEIYLTGELHRDFMRWGEGTILRTEHLHRIEYEQYKCLAYACVLVQGRYRSATRSPAYTSLSIPAPWDESKHPRDDRGRFGYGSGGSYGSSGNKKVDDDWIKKLNDSSRPMRSGSGTLYADSGAVVSDAGGGIKRESSGTEERFRTDNEWKNPLPLAPWDKRLSLLLTVPKTSAKDGIYKTQVYCPSVDEDNFQRKIGELRTSSPEAMRTYVGGLALDQRLAMTAILGDTKDLPLRMTLLGVPPDMQKKVAIFDVAYGKVPKKNAATFAPYYEAFMENASTMDLPKTMREETRVLEGRVATAVEKNGERIREGYKQWKDAGGNKTEKIKILESFISTFTASIGAGSMDIRQIAAANSSNVAAVHQNAPNTIVINIDHPLFSQDKPEEFALLLGALPHEILHSKQFKTLMANRWFEKDSAKAPEKSLLHIPSIEAINLVGYIEGSENTFAYIAQPMELQAHLLQKAARKAILKQLAQP